MRGPVAWCRAWEESEQLPTRFEVHRLPMALRYTGSTSGRLQNFCRISTAGHPIAVNLFGFFAVSELANIHWKSGGDFVAFPRLAWWAVLIAQARRESAHPHSSSYP